MIWITSDWHLGCPNDKMSNLWGRPFDDHQGQLRTLVRNYNSVVNTDDTVIVVGDVVDINVESDPLKQLEKVNQFNGKKILIRGNHDIQFTDSQLLRHFERVIPDGDGLFWKLKDGDMIGDVPDNLESFYITHYPSTAKSNKFNLVGHIHSTWLVQKNMINIGVDANHFRPWNFSKILFKMNAIKNFYDSDVWAYNLEANKVYEDQRGKKSSYSQKLV